MTPQYSIRCFRLLSAVLAVMLAGCGGTVSNPKAPALSSQKNVVLLTTTSAQDTGLLDVLQKDFAERSGYELKVIAVGTGAALKQAALGEGDVVLVHDADAEKKWLADGNGTSRRLVMYNDFVVVGPAGDPARIRGLSAAQAFAVIAKERRQFISRGDKSGTHTRESELWRKAGVDPHGQDWYAESGSGMGTTLNIASDQERYALCDRSTFLAHQKRLRLKVLVESDPALLNLYHVMTVNPEKFPKTNAAGGEAFADYLLSAEGQKIIAEFGKDRFGQALFTPAAGKNETGFQQP